MSEYSNVNDVDASAPEAAFVPASEGGDCLNLQKFARHAIRARARLSRRQLDLVQNAQESSMFIGNDQYNEDARYRDGTVVCNDANRFEFTHIDASSVMMVIVVMAAMMVMAVMAAVAAVVVMVMMVMMVAVIVVVMLPGQKLAGARTKNDSASGRAEQQFVLGHVVTYPFVGIL